MTWAEAPHEGECWGISRLIFRRPVTRVFDMHWEDCWPPDDLSRMLQKAKEANAQYISCKNYPLKEVMERFQTDYFTGSVDYAIALALYEGFTEINLYGVSYSDASEYTWQLPGVNFWCGVAKGMGVNLKVHGTSNVMKLRDGKMYGYDTPPGWVG